MYMTAIPVAMTYGFNQYKYFLNSILIFLLRYVLGKSYALRNVAEVSS
jgi:hypothetical protein